MKFKNGFAGSVVRGLDTYGGPEGLWEVAVLDNEGLAYYTPITHDVIGDLTAEGVLEVLREIAELKPGEAGESRRGTNSLDRVMDSLMMQMFEK